MKNKITIVTLSLILVVGVYFLYTQVFTAAYPVEPPEVREKLLSKLDEKGIWYMRDGSGVVRFLKSDLDKIIQYGSLVSNEIVPMSRSFAPAPGEFDSTVSRLEEQSIKYEVRQFNGVEWIVLPPEYEGRVAEVIFGGI